MPKLKTPVRFPLEEQPRYTRNWPLRPLYHIRACNAEREGRGFLFDTIERYFSFGLDQSEHLKEVLEEAICGPRHTIPFRPPVISKAFDEDEPGPEERDRWQRFTAAIQDNPDLD